MEGDKFPMGLKVLVVDDNLPCLKILERQLINCKYKVTTTTEAVTALEMLRTNKDKFDIVLSDVHMPEMDGFKLLELIGLELDIPVIMLSGSDNPELVMKGVRHGAVDYLVKPARIEELKNIWQHVIRKSQSKQKGKAYPNSDARDDGDNNANQEETRSRKRKEQNTTEDHLDEDDECKNEGEDSNTQKKPRVVWLPELHRKFVAAVDQLGPDNAFPKKILDLMNVEGITRENVASHLQKYRIYLKRLNSSSDQTTDASIQDPYGVYCSLGSQFNVYSSGLSQASSSHFQHQNNNSAKVGVPCLEDYTRCMESWKNTPGVNRPIAQQNMLRTNQLPYNSLNDISYLQNALERTVVDVSSAPAYSFGSQNVCCNLVESNSFGQNSSAQYNGIFDSPAGQMNGTSGFVQNTVQDDEVDALMVMDDSYLLESPELVDGFTQSNGGNLEDLVNGFLK